MIDYLRGKIHSKNNLFIILDVNGVGYGVTVSLNTYGALPELNQTAELHIYTDVRENSIKLYGFFEAKEKEMFLRLTEVNGIGPKGALNLLSRISPDRLINLILNEDTRELTKVPGIGNKTAQKVIIELKDKLSKSYSVKSDLNDGYEENVTSDVFNDALSGLLTLGYSREKATDTLKSLEKSNFDNLEKLLKEALKKLSKF